MSSTPSPTLTDPGTDLTRWNRAGLSRYRYVDGNAVTYLEFLRQQLADAFPQWRQVAVGEAPEDEDPRRRIERLLAQYQQERGDWGWEISRAFVRALHSLTEHLDAYANESTLATATQWQNLRRLVEMIDYRPAPPASAVTPWALELKAEQAGWVPSGLAAKWAPPDGAPPVFFESLEGLEADAACNALRLRDWNRSPRVVSGNRLVVEGGFEDLVLGQPVVVEHEPSGRLEARRLRAATVELSVDPSGLGGEQERTVLTLDEPLASNLRWRRGDLILHLAPAEQNRLLGPAETGAQLGRGVALEELAEGRPEDDGAPENPLRPGEVVVLEDGEHTLWAMLTRVDERWVVLDREAGPFHLDSAWLSRPHRVAVADRRGRRVESGPEPGITAVRVSGDYSRLQGRWVADRVASSSDGSRLETFRVFAAVYRPVDSARPDGGGYTTLRLEDPDNLLSNPQGLYVPPVVGEWKLDTYLRPAGRRLPATVELRRALKKTFADTPAVMVQGRQLAWGRVTRVAGAAAEAAPTLSVEGWRQRRGGNFFLATTRLWSAYKHSVRMWGWRHNPTPLTSALLPLELAGPALLTAGRRLLLEERAGEAVTAVLEAQVVRLEDRRRQLVIEPAPDDRFTVGGCVVRANVLTAGHGKAENPKVLGSGDGTRSGQSFVLEEEVAFVPDVAMPSGVAAALQITVGDRIFQQVSTLAQCAPPDACFETRMTEDGHLRLLFGDGVRGQRLPTGVNNVRASFRKGRGPAGNVDAFAFVKPAEPHPLVEAIVQPLPAVGGAEMEGAESLRTLAPRSLLTLDRAVSLADFSALAGRQSSIWQARAFRAASRPGRRGEVVEVVVVPAGGGELGDLGEILRAYLSARALPGVSVTVVPYEPRPVELEVRYRVRSEAYDLQRVGAALSAALLEAFSLRQRRLGVDLFVSDVYRVAEGVEGVENTLCILDGDPDRRRLRASARQLLFLDGDGRGLNLKPEEATL
ncbi:MAG: hypothetical protein AAGD01_10820 [Acidobacteriota bacterium]